MFMKIWIVILIENTHTHTHKKNTLITDNILHY